MKKSWLRRNNLYFLSILFLVLSITVGIFAFNHNPLPTTSTVKAAGTGELSITSTDASFTSGTQKQATLTNTQALDSGVTVGLGGTTLNWTDTLNLWKAWDSSATSNAANNKITTSDGASLTLSNQYGQEALEVYVPQDGAHKGQAPFEVNTPALSDRMKKFTLTPILPDGTQGTSQTFTNTTDPYTKDPSATAKSIDSDLVNKDHPKKNPQNFLVSYDGNDEGRVQMNLNGSPYGESQIKSGVFDGTKDIMIQLPSSLGFSFEDTVEQDGGEPKTGSSIGMPGAYLFGTNYVEGMKDPAWGPNITKEANGDETMQAEDIYYHRIDFTYTKATNQIKVHYVKPIPADDSSGSGPLGLFFTVKKGGGGSIYDVKTWFQTPGKTDKSEEKAFNVNVLGQPVPPLQLSDVDGSNNLSGASFKFVDTKDKINKTTSDTDKTGRYDFVPAILDSNSSNGAKNYAMNLTQVDTPKGYKTLAAGYKVKWTETWDANNGATTTGVTGVQGPGDTTWSTTATGDNVLQIKNGV